MLDRGVNDWRCSQENRPAPAIFFIRYAFLIAISRADCATALWADRPVVTLRDHFYSYCGSLTFVSDHTIEAHILKVRILLAFSVPVSEYSDNTRRRAASFGGSRSPLRWLRVRRQRSHKDILCMLIYGVIT